MKNSTEKSGEGVRVDSFRHAVTRAKAVNDDQVEALAHRVHEHPGIVEGQRVDPSQHAVHGLGRTLAIGHSPLSQSPFGRIQAGTIRVLDPARLQPGRATRRSEETP